MESGFSVEPPIPPVECLPGGLLLLLCFLFGSLFFCKSLVPMEETLKRAHCGWGWLNGGSVWWHSLLCVGRHCDGSLVSVSDSFDISRSTVGLLIGWDLDWVREERGWCCCIWICNFWRVGVWIMRWFFGLRYEIRNIGRNYMVLYTNHHPHYEQP